MAAAPTTNAGSVRRKRLLLVIRDNIEFRNVFNPRMLRLARFFDISVTAPVVDDPAFRADVASVIDAEFISWPDRDGMKFHLAKLFYALKLLAFLSANAGRSQSCYQKSWQLILGRVPTSKFMQPGMKAILVVLSILLLPFRHFDPSRSFACHEKTAFDLILYGRPDSFDNLMIWQRHGGPWTKVITAIRNIDTVYLKGPPAIRSDYCLAFDTNAVSAIKAFGYARQYGTPLHCPHYLTSYQRLVPSTNDKYRVLYCSNRPIFLQDQPAYVERLLAKAKASHSNVEVDLLIHADDDAEYYRLQLAKSGIGLADYDRVTYRRGNEAVQLESIEGIRRFADLLLGYDLVVAFASTILDDAVKLRVNVMPLEQIMTAEEIAAHAWVLDREHVQLVASSVEQSGMRSAL